MFGWRKDEIMGEDVSVLMPDPYREHHDLYVKRFRETGMKKLLGIPRELLGVYWASVASAHPRAAVRKDGIVFPVELALGECGSSEDGAAFVASFRKSVPRTTTSNAEEPVEKIFVSRYDTEYEEVLRLGRGGFGSVFLVRHVLNGVKLGYYAVKKIPVGDNHDWLRTMLREVRMHERLHHTNIVSYKHSWTEYHKHVQGSSESLTLFIVMEAGG